jgi:hypothetical protein
MFPTFLKRIIPVHARPTVIVVAIVAIVLALSLFTQVPEKTPQYGPRAAARMRLLTGSVENTYAKAQRAQNVHQQLMYVHWAMAMLESTRTLAADDDALSVIADVDIRKLDATLRAAEARCITLIENKEKKSRRAKREE